MAKFLDLLSQWSILIGAAAFAVTWAIAAAHRISGEERPLWQVAYFKYWVATTVAGIGLALGAEQVLKYIVRQEIQAVLHDPRPKRVIIYANGRATLQKPDFIAVLNNLDVNWSAGSHFMRNRYKMVIVSDDTVARFTLAQNDADTTLYQVHYPKYSTTSTNEIGIIKAEQLSLRKL